MKQSEPASTHGNGRGSSRILVFVMLAVIVVAFAVFMYFGPLKGGDAAKSVKKPIAVPASQ